MGVALSVFRLIPRSDGNLLRDLTTIKQITFQDQELSDGLPSSRSDLFLKEYDADKKRAYYRAEHVSRPIKQTIRVTADAMEDEYGEVRPVHIIHSPVKNAKTALRRRYQEVDHFDVEIDFSTNEIFVFAKKEVANGFMRQFRRSRDLHGDPEFEYAPLYFDLSRITEIPNLANVFGAWANSQGNVKKRAYFGTDVHKSEDFHPENITSFIIEVEDGEEVYDFFVGHDCRISSKLPTLEDKHLVEYSALFKTKLGVFDDPPRRTASQAA